MFAKPSFSVNFYKNKQDAIEPTRIEVEEYNTKKCFYYDFTQTVSPLFYGIVYPCFDFSN